MTILIIFWLIFWGLFGFVVGQKKKAPGEGFALGLILGPIGLLLIALRPDVQQQQQETPVLESDPVVATVKTEAVKSFQAEPAPLGAPLKILLVASLIGNALLGMWLVDLQARPPVKIAAPPKTQDSNPASDLEYKAAIQRVWDANTVAMQWKRVAFENARLLEAAHIKASPSTPPQN